MKVLQAKAAFEQKQKRQAAPGVSSRDRLVEAHAQGIELGQLVISDGDTSILKGGFKKGPVNRIHIGQLVAQPPDKGCLTHNPGAGTPATVGLCSAGLDKKPSIFLRHPVRTAAPESTEVGL
ncbi:TPA: hypothetical protein ACIRVE_005380 [Pseudomonas putida]